MVGPIWWELLLVFWKPNLLIGVLGFFACVWMVLGVTPKTSDGKRVFTPTVITNFHRRIALLHLSDWSHWITFWIMARHVLLHTFQCISHGSRQPIFSNSLLSQTCWQLLENSLQLQDKYKKKKAKKYLNHVTLIRPCARSLADFYFQKMPMKIAGMRSDTLAILLSLANISADSRTLVVDAVGGLVAGEYNLLSACSTLPV